jgi:hypothetical protein
MSTPRGVVFVADRDVVDRQRGRGFVRQLLFDPSRDYQRQLTSNAEKIYETWAEFSLSDPALGGGLRTFLAHDERPARERRIPKRNAAASS